MPDKKLTDNEIIKALECCTTNGASCKDCPAFVKVDRSNCKKYFRGALDLINRQNADLIKKDKQLTEALKNSAVNKTKVIDYEKEINRLQAENERLKNAYKQVAWERDIFAEDMKQEIKKDCSYLMLDIKTIKAEAYKECMARVEDRLSHKLSPELLKYIHNDLQDELKKMVGRSSEE